MTRDKVKQLLPVIQAYAEGKTVQHRSSPTSKWHDVGIFEEITFMDDPGCYRIKPEPREWTIRPHSMSGEIPVVTGPAIDGFIRVREILED